MQKKYAGFSEPTNKLLSAAANIDNTACSLVVNDLFSRQNLELVRLVSG
jgi:hypothetical protein